ncbi:MAG: HD domain-containing phosphohydrolase [Candidatus Brocadiia bacterium]|jgi:response regulator RpfG family c-di-GMP phosphodiesterase
MKIELVALKGQVYTRPFQLGDGQKLVLGRGEDADIQILDSGLSRQHCCIEKVDEDYFVCDLASTNGTWVNDARIERRRLNPGDRVRIGAVEFEFRCTPDRRRMKADFIAQVPDRVEEIRQDLKLEDSSLMELTGEAENIENYRRVQRDLATIYQIGNLLSAESRLDALYKRILDEILKVVRADRAILLLAGPAGSLETVAHKETSAAPGVPRGFSTTVVEECYRNRTSVLMSNALLDEHLKQVESVIAQNIQSVLCVPVETPERAIGILYVDSVGQSEAFLKCDLQLLLAIGKQAGLAIQRTQLSDQLRQMLRGTVRALAAAIEAKDDYTLGHSERVTHFALEIGRRMQLGETHLGTLELAGFLHDVGKIGVPESILRKAGPLTDAEFEVVKKHSRLGSEIIRNIEGAAEIAEIVLHHHERWDGKGYPDGLKHEEASLLSRILAAADAFDAMCSRRPYRDRLALEKVIQTVHKASGVQFDPRVVEALLDAVSEGRILPGSSRKTQEVAAQPGNRQSAT